MRFHALATAYVDAVEDGLDEDNNRAVYGGDRAIAANEGAVQTLGSKLSGGAARRESGAGKRESRYDYAGHIPLAAHYVISNCLCEWVVYAARSNKCYSQQLSVSTCCISHMSRMPP